MICKRPEVHFKIQREIKHAREQSHSEMMLAQSVKCSHKHPGMEETLVITEAGGSLELAGQLV